MDCEQMVDAVRNWLDDNDFEYDYDAENHMITLTTRLGSKIKTGMIRILFADDSYTVYLVSPISGDTENLEELTKYLTMANYGLRNGNFELDIRDGEIRYKIFVNADGLESLSEEVIKDSIVVGCLMMDRYGNGIASLVFGFSDAETEIKKSEEDLMSVVGSDDSDDSDE